MTKERAMELLENAMSFIQDNGMMSEFLEDRFIELSYEEKEYFEIYEGWED